MIESGEGARLLFKSSQALGLCGKLTWQHLDRHVSTQPAVPRPKHFPHPARA